MDKRNKSIIFSFVLVSILLLLIFSSQISAMFAVTGINSTNLVSNPNFETGKIIYASNANGLGQYDWVAKSTDSTHNITIDSTVSHSGSKSLHFHQVDGSSKIWLSAEGDSIITSPGKRYYVEVYIKTANLPTYTGSANTSSNEYKSGGYPSRFMLEVQHYNTTKNELTGRVSVWNTPIILTDSSYSASTQGEWDDNRNSDWKKYIGYFTISSGVQWFRPAFYLYSNGGDVWVDDLRISEVQQDENAYLSNPSFEIWGVKTECVLGTNGFCQDVPLGVTSQYEGRVYQSTDAYDGNYSLGIQKTATQNMWAGFQNIQNLQQGKLYEISAYVKTTSKTGFLYTQRMDTWALIGSGAYPQGTGQWEKLSVKFVSPYTGDSTHMYRFGYQTKDNVPVLIDKFELKVLKDSVPSCTTITTCKSSETCSQGYCLPLTCNTGYHAEDHMCVEGSVSNNTVWIIAGVIVGIIVVYFIFFRKK